MLNYPFNIIPITKARSRLGKLADQATKDNYIILTKDGTPKAAIVDIQYLTSLENQLRKTYRKTFIDPKLIKYTREFSDEETKEWEKEDAL